MALRLHSEAASPLPGGEEKLPDSAVSALGLIIVTILLLSFGLTMLYSASFTTSGISFFKKQLIWIALGISGGLCIFDAGYQRICHYRGVLLLICWGMLIAALFFSPVNGARRWIRFALPALGEVSIKPSEFAKIALCLFVAGYCTYFSRFFSRFFHVNGIIPLGFYAAVTCGLVWAGKDMGTCLLILGSAGAIMVAGGLYMRYALIGGGAALCYFVWEIVSNPERLARVMTVFGPVKDTLGDGYQLDRSLMALGSGGWLGLGFGQSRLKTRYLPEQHTDFILAVVGEELGLVAIWLVILLYLMWGFFAVRIAVSARSKLGMLLAFGLAMAIQLQATINLAVVSGSAPTKGMPAPFISYGGSNVASSIIAVSLLLSVAMETIRPGYSDAFRETIRNKFRKNK
ncbi:MAG: FtsW/RodA/SpoVE family cell cycle protein [Lentisphaeria bacterium]|nr:FtsW/RodA/SpoVE family cell cycle protein [Lentisphaeria bacterium]